MTQPLKVLCIGNGFSQDASWYLEQIAAAGTIPMLVRNLYIGGCSLERHADNLKHLAFEYEYQQNGRHLFDTLVPGRKKGISIRMALRMEEWDVVTVQQVSQLSGIYESDIPYLAEMLKVIRSVCPRARIFFHSTWAYELDSQHTGFENYQYDQQRMVEAIEQVTARISEQYSLPVIPSGKLIQMLRQTAPFDYAHGGLSLCRDGFQLSRDYGRYAVGLLWYHVLTGMPVTGNSFAPPDTDPALIQLIQQTVDSL